jgi:hypothetical protein
LTGVSQKDWKCRTNFYDAETVKGSNGKRDYEDEDGNKFEIKADATISLTAVTTEKKWHDQCCVEKMMCSEFTCDAKKGRISDHTKDASRFGMRPLQKLIREMRLVARMILKCVEATLTQQQTPTTTTRKWDVGRLIVFSRTPASSSSMTPMERN